MSNDQTKHDLEGIAIIGMSCNFPGASNVNTFWENLCNGTESIRHFSDEELDPSVPASLKNDPNYVKARGVLEGVEQFDARFFGMNARESEIMDPQQRIFLQLAWHALEHAGYDPDTYEGMIGVYAGMATSSYYIKNILSRPEKVSSVGEFQAQIANEKDYLSTRVSYKLNLKGPSLSINTACSTSLVAIASACESLLSYQCDMAMAGGVSIIFPQNSGYLYRDVNIFSKDGHCRPFDAKGGGTVPGNGGGIVVLKRLEEAIDDRDLIYGVIKGSAVNNDGAVKMSYMAPSVAGQANVLSMALANSELNPTDLSYIEAHGTATVIGDPIEFEALKQVYGSGHNQKGFCGLGSVKGNVGHMDRAAGVAGLIKTVLSLYHGQIPPTLHYASPNPKIDMDDSPFYVNQTLSPWPKGETPRRAGVSSFGVGGTNAHVIVEEAPVQAESGASRPVQLMTLSAKTEESLDGITGDFKSFLQNSQEKNLADAAYTLQTSRKAFKHRKIIVCSQAEDALEALESKRSRFIASGKVESEKPIIAFMFPGQGSHYVNMGLSFYQHEPAFKEAIDVCASILKPLIDLDIRHLIYPKDEESQTAADDLKKTCYNQPAIFTIEYALAKLWESWGITPSTMVGHSIGEYAAATLAGIFELEDALKIVAERGRLMQELPSGSMLMAFIALEDLEKRLPESLSIAAVNAPTFCVVSGENDEIQKFKEELSQDDITCRILKTSHAFHSAMMDPAVELLKQQVEKVTLSKPKIPYVSATTGEWITDEQATDPAYWAKHLRQPVLFSKAVTTLLDENKYTLLEVGPRSTLTFLARQHMDSSSKQEAIASLADTNEENLEWFSILTAMGRLWLAGCEVDWPSFYEREKRNKCSLPGYHFGKESYFIEPGKNNASTPEAAENETSIEHEEEVVKPSAPDAAVGLDVASILEEIWKDVLPDAGSCITESNDFFADGGHSLLAVEFFTDIQKQTGIDLPLTTLLGAPTFGQILQALNERTKEVRGSTTTSSQAASSPSQPAWSALVKIKPKGSKTPFFCMHAIGGNVLNYFPLATVVDADQPFYGLQARGTDGLLEPCSTIEEMAALYIKEIKQIQPSGPYLLGGGSLGGLIAYEMAQQLQHMGDEVGLLMLFDTYGPGETDVYFGRKEESLHRSLSEKFGQYMKKIKCMSGKNQLSYMLKSAQVRVDFWMKVLSIRLHRLCSKPLPHKLRFWYVEWMHTQAAKQYRTKKYNGKLILFRAIPEQDIANFDRTNGWCGMASDGIDIREIPGSHTDIIENPLLGDLLKSYLHEFHDETATE